MSSMKKHNFINEEASDLGQEPFYNVYADPLN